MKAFDDLDLDVVIYDVLGDVVCGGFAVPIREGIAKHVFTVSSADFMAIYAANNLFRGIKKYSGSGGALLGGVIANSINAPYAKEIIDDFVRKTATQVDGICAEVGYREPEREIQGKTTIEASPDRGQARIYTNLALKIVNHAESKTPSPLDEKALREWASQWADRILAIETGEVRGAASNI